MGEGTAVMTTPLWIVLSAVLALSFGGFVLLVLLGYKNDKALSRGEMRRAITAFFVLLFGSLVVASFFPIDLELPDTVQGLFVGTVTTVVGFYFGSRTAAPPPTGG
jgi:hypothetical protein